VNRQLRLGYLGETLSTLVELWRGGQTQRSNYPMTSLPPPVLQPLFGLPRAHPGTQDLTPKSGSTCKPEETKAPNPLLSTEVYQRSDVDTHKQYYPYMAPPFNGRLPIPTFNLIIQHGCEDRPLDVTGKP